MYVGGSTNGMVVRWPEDRASVSYLFFSQMACWTAYRILRLRSGSCRYVLTETLPACMRLICLKMSNSKVGDRGSGGDVKSKVLACRSSAPHLPDSKDLSLHPHVKSSSSCAISQA